tara:strand:+ start:420 stop:683 length:264 start_codon:yes stop_codon:yes gene_type:complete
MNTLKVLSIDAWREGSSWQWNQWFNVGTIDIDINASNRQILKTMRDQGYLSDQSKGRVSIDDDEYNIVICDRNNNEPIFAIEYGSQV